MSESMASFEELIEGVEKFAADELSKMAVRVMKVEKRQDSLEAKLKDLEKQVESKNAVTETKMTAQDSFMRDLDFRINEFYKETGESAKGITQRALQAALQSLDISAEGAELGPPARSSSPIPSTCSLSTSQFYSVVGQDLDELPTEVQEKLKPFCGIPSASDKLASVQRAFFKYFMSIHPNDKLGDAFVELCIREGKRMSVWSDGFTPEGVSDFRAYLKERMRNERKSAKKLSLKSSQRQRLSSYLQDSLKMFVVPNQEENMDVQDSQTEKDD